MLIRKEKHKTKSRLIRFVFAEAEYGSSWLIQRRWCTAILRWLGSSMCFYFSAKMRLLTEFSAPATVIYFILLMLELSLFSSAHCEAGHWTWIKSLDCLTHCCTFTQTESIMWTHTHTQIHAPTQTQTHALWHRQSSRNTVGCWSPMNLSSFYWFFLHLCCL